MSQMQEPKSIWTPLEQKSTSGGTVSKAAPQRAMLWDSTSPSQHNASSSRTSSLHSEWRCPSPATSERGRRQAAHPAPDYHTISSSSVAVSAPKHMDTRARLQQVAASLRHSGLHSDSVKIVVDSHPRHSKSPRVDSKSNEDNPRRVDQEEAKASSGTDGRIIRIDHSSTRVQRQPTQVVKHLERLQSRQEAQVETFKARMDKLMVLLDDHAAPATGRPKMKAGAVELHSKPSCAPTAKGAAASPVLTLRTCEDDASREISITPRASIASPFLDYSKARRLTKQSEFTDQRQETTKKEVAIDDDAISVGTTISHGSSPGMLSSIWCVEGASPSVSVCSSFSCRFAGDCPAVGTTSFTRLRASRGQVWAILEDRCATIKYTKGKKDGLPRLAARPGPPLMQRSPRTEPSAHAAGRLGATSDTRKSRGERLSTCKTNLFNVTHVKQRSYSMHEMITEVMC